jgi:hypothetical protein
MRLRRALIVAVPFLLAFGLVAPTADAGTAMVRDRTRDVEPSASVGAADLISAGAVYQGGTFLLSATVAAMPGDLYGGPWADPATRLTWYLTGSSGADEYSVSWRTEGGGHRSEVTRLSTGAVMCNGYFATTAWGAFQTIFPSTCAPGLSRFRAEIAYRVDGVTNRDMVPDAGWSDVVIESGPSLAVNDHPAVPADVRSGYWMLGADGSVYAFGDVRDLGDVTSTLAPWLPSGVLTERAVDIDVSPNGRGYWIATDRGQVALCYASGGWACSPTWWSQTAPSPYPPSTGSPVTSISVTPSGNGFWLFTEKGAVITYGDAKSFGALSDRILNAPIVDSVATPSGQGYYMVAADGGVFSFGDARFAGSTGDRKLNAPVRSLVPDGDGSGYWLVATDGGIFAFDAPFRGSMGATTLNKPVKGMIRYGDGYLMVAEDGGIFNFSDLPFAGSLGDNPPVHPIVSVAALSF